MTFSFITTYIGSLILRAVANIIVFTPTIIISLYIYDHFLKNTTNKSPAPSNTQRRYPSGSGPSGWRELVSSWLAGECVGGQGALV